MATETIIDSFLLLCLDVCLLTNWSDFKIHLVSGWNRCISSNVCCWLKFQDYNCLICILIKYSNSANNLSAEAILWGIAWGFIYSNDDKSWSVYTQNACLHFDKSVLVSIFIFDDIDSNQIFHLPCYHMHNLSSFLLNICNIWQTD